MQIVPLKQSHLEEASKLFAATYNREREAVPILDENFGSAEIIRPKLESILERFPGVVAFDNGKLIGYMIGVQIDKFLGVHKGAYSPEWGHASTAENAFEIYRLMYQTIGQQWVENGCLTHAINFLNHAKEAQEAFVWNGFGGICIDAVRPVEPLGVELPEGIRISLIEEKDIPIWLPMVDAQTRHLSRSPNFIPYLEPERADELENFLKQPGNFAWMAWQGDKAIGYMRITPIGNGAAWIVNGEKKFAINGAYVDPEHRGKGIAKELLSTIMDWGEKEKFVRCSVDFEVTNIEACKFWLRHFQPVCRSFIRRLDEQILKTM